MLEVLYVACMCSSVTEFIKHGNADGACVVINLIGTVGSTGRGQLAKLLAEAIEARTS